jgi:hypothetical protein
MEYLEISELCSQNEESTMMMEEEFSSETSVNISQCTRIHVGQ